MKEKLILVFAIFALTACSRQNDEVYITPYGHRYHHSWCKTIQGHSIRGLSIEEAQDLGKTPCHVCY